ncbi:Microsomal glutathione S-transferase 3 [Rhynchospora pubera]|uniref:Microsomal glutathione S-transferase 3 n=1 Tax=Rhynchospora pubera TaxID=906938 RepID=A0AAV8D7C4_9POAL|nr:Microsomal glutathione S-transferase 3 [Rhynchospora pubera]
MALGILLPKRYGYVVLDLVAYVFLHTWMEIQLGKARRQYNVPYPNLYAVQPENQDSFNWVVRGHRNSMELMPIFFVMLLVGGLKHPLISAGLGALYIVSRFYYFKVDSTDNRVGLL